MSIRSTWIRRAYAALFGVALVACTAEAPPEEDDADLESEVVARRSFAISAGTVKALGRSLAGVAPAVDQARGGLPPEKYLVPQGPLGPTGPLGAWGPLGALGPLGDGSWNPSTFVSAVGDWSAWSRDLTNLGGPLSEDGPLGPSGALGARGYGVTLPSFGGPAKQLQLGGVFTALGPAGPLGPLGPLGPVGAHGYPQDTSGDYRSRGAIVRTVDVPYRGKLRAYELFESYTKERAAEMTNNDTSFMVTAALDHVDASDTYGFVSQADQYVTVVLVPENGLSDFDFEILARDGSTVVRSDVEGHQETSALGLFTEGTFIDFAQFRARRGARLTARVWARQVAPKTPRYRLIVVGSTAYLPAPDIRGPHQGPCACDLR